MAQVRYRLGPNSKPAELLAALGETLATYQDRDYVYVPQRKRLVLHAAACRDFCCGECGSGLVTRNIDGQWRTVCARNSAHSQAGFVTTGSYATKQAQARARAGAAD